MKKYFVIFITLLTIGCASEQEQHIVDDSFKGIGPYCRNQLDLIRANPSAVYLNPREFEGKRIAPELDSIFSDEHCDMIIECAVRVDIENRMILTNPKSFPLKMEFHKICEIHTCGFKNYMEVLMNANHQILFEGEYLQMNEVKDRIPLYYSYSDTVLNVKPSKTIMTMQWDAEVDVDTLSLLLMNIIDGYFLALDEFSINKFNSKVCDLDYNQMDSLQNEFPFRLELPNYEEIPVPEIIEKCDTE